MILNLFLNYLKRNINRYSNLKVLIFHENIHDEMGLVEHSILLTYIL